jgi:hypothetical protein
MFKTYISVAVAAAVSLSAGSAFAANNTAILSIQQADGKSWTENVSGLLVVDANNNFSMVNGASTTGIYQDGSFKTTIDTTVHPDYWQWITTNATTGVGYWNWHSAETLLGNMPSTTTSADPWLAVLNLKNVSGHGDPDISYDIFSKNNSNSAQTYTFTTSGNISPVVSSANVVHADLTTDTTNTATQKFELSSNGGSTFTNAGVDIITSGTTGTPVTFAANASGPIAASWDYMRTVTTFTLAAKTGLTEFSGFASITPVPEPESYAMMLSGLVLLASMAYRRKL